MNDSQRKPKYLASPYTHPSARIRQARFEAVTRVAATLVQRGNIIYSPITMTHPLDVILAGKSATLGSDFWVAFDEAFMRMCSEIIVLRLEGWERSSGVTREVTFFHERGLTVSYIDPSAFGVADVRLDDVERRLLK